MMIKNATCLLVLFGMVCSVCLADETEQQKKDSKESIRISRNYLKECKADERTVSIGNLGWEEVREYWAKVPSLQALRDEFDKCDEELKDVLMQDEEYSEYMENREGKSPADYNKMKSSVFRRLQKSSSPYRKAREKREEALYQSNIESFEFIIDDYEEKGWVIPTKWMNHRH
jgi:hypothetical protein